MWPGAPTDITGKLKITTKINAATSGNIVIEVASGKQIGVYLDDSTPRLSMWVKTALAAHVGKVFVSVPTSEKHHRWPNPAINLLEWYPYNAGWDVGEMPKCEGYILQCKYPGYDLARKPGAKLAHPTLAQYRELLAEAHGQHPEYLFKF